MVPNYTPTGVLLVLLEGIDSVELGSSQSQSLRAVVVLADGSIGTDVDTISVDTLLFSILSLDILETLSNSDVHLHHIVVHSGLVVDLQLDDGLAERFLLVT